MCVILKTIHSRSAIIFSVGTTTTATEKKRNSSFQLLSEQSSEAFYNKEKEAFSHPLQSHDGRCYLAKTPIVVPKKHIFRQKPKKQLLLMIEEKF